MHKVDNPRYKYLGFRVSQDEHRRIIKSFGSTSAVREFILDLIRKQDAEKEGRNDADNPSGK
jgi:hypothetical protein